MPIMKSISGIRGTIGERQGEDLTMADIRRFTAAYAAVIADSSNKERIKLVVGRDARESGADILNLVCDTLISLGHDIYNIGLAATPTVEMEVIRQKTDGGIIISASHNPAEWNALKLLDNQGEFLSAESGRVLLEIADKNYCPSVSDSPGSIFVDQEASARHIADILKLKLVDRKNIASAGLKVVVDGINSVGGIIVPELLDALGVKEVVKINCEPNGRFIHNPEPLAINLEDTMRAVKESGADLGIVVDPDVDRLAFIDENGEMFGEEYTLVAVADYVLANYCQCFYQKISVSNLSSSRALRDITEKRGGSYFPAAVGELNVVAEMKKRGAVIGGEGNGGVIYPELHYGRDALVGIALFLSYLVGSSLKVSELKQKMPSWFMAKNKVQLGAGTDLKSVLERIKIEYKNEIISDIDGVKIDFPDSWVHLRASNTEPIVRIYAEAKSQEQADNLALAFVNKLSL